MSIWTHILDLGVGLFSSEPVQADDPNCSPDPGDVGFTAAIVGLGAKLAMADGRVTDDEVMAFSRVFKVGPDEIASIQRLFNIARKTVKGYEAYAARIGHRYKDRPCLLEGVLDGLFQIALADGVITQHEMDYLENVAHAFGMSEQDFRRIRASYMGLDKNDPYHILGVSPDSKLDDIKRAYRRLMLDNHPDRIAATRNTPSKAFDNIAHRKAASISEAYATIKKRRAGPHFAK